MFYYLATFVLILYLPVATLAIECMKCDQTLNLTISERLNITRPDCTKTKEGSDVCMGMLITQFEERSTQMDMGHLPEQVVIFSNGNKMIITSTMISLSKNKTFQTIQLLDMDSAVIASELNKTYNTTKTFKYEELRTKLSDHLHAPISFVSDLTCSDNQGKTVPCPNGFCQWTGTSTTTVDRKCVRQGKGANPSGITIAKTDVEGSDTAVLISYACNKAMCNGDGTNQKVQQLLGDYGLLEQKRAVQSNSGITTTYKTMVHFQWVLLLIMTSFFKI